MRIPSPLPKAFGAPCPPILPTRRFPYLVSIHNQKFIILGTFEKIDVRSNSTGDVDADAARTLYHLFSRRNVSRAPGVAPLLLRASNATQMDDHQRTI
ncbi:hypothetical protein BS78_05G268400 [Paspalum vaginatum]|nr:hypothetical protein BS78_05G268400 [Paspalum vaginatum]